MAFGVWLLISAVWVALAAQSRADPEEDMTFCEIAEHNGYACEEYLNDVETEDGFLLTLHRITGRLSESSRKARSPSQRPAVFVQHGLLCDSTAWILNLPQDNLPYHLSDAGYDVWLGNSRGNTYSSKHVRLNPSENEFWAWSWDEMALFDLPASIDFVLNSTGLQSLYYIGHSQGTLIAFTHLSLTHSTKIKHLIALGPVFHVEHMTSPMRLAAPYSRELELLFHVFGVKDFLPSNKIIHFLADYVCGEKRLEKYCANVLFLIAGSDIQQLNESRLSVYIAHSPAGTSVQNMIHFAQMVESGVCERFDYGKILNEVHYGQPSPPVYTLNVTCPVSLFWAENDSLADPQDVQFLVKNLSNVQNAVEIPAWDHLDFLWAVDATSTVYNRVLSILKNSVAIATL